MSVEKALAAHLSNFDASPVLFIGSGLSRRYVGLEDWEGLLSRFSKVIERPFAYYKSTCDGNLPRAAGKLALDFHDKWWSEKEFEESRDEFISECTRNSSALKIEISKYVSKLSGNLTADAVLLEEVEYLRNAVFDGIITTNWDLFLEKLFPDFVKYVGQSDIIFESLHGVGEIFKIHGCCSDPNSLVLTDEDYAEFNTKYPYLTAKLLTIFVEHPIIFLGYSMSDDNITAIVESIGKCLPPDKIEKLKDRLIFVRRAHGGESVGDGLLRIGDTNVATKEFAVESFVSIFRPLSTLHRKFPAKLLRRLKEHVYDLVLTNDPKGKVYVQDIDDAGSDDLEVVFGVGAISELQARGYLGIHRLDLLKDILDDSKLDAKAVLNTVVPQIRNPKTFIPVFKYLRKTGRIAADGSIDTTGLEEPVIARAKATIATFRQGDSLSSLKQRIPEIDIGVAEFFAKYGIKSFATHASQMKRSKIDMDRLVSILRDNFSTVFEGGGVPQPYPSYFAKLICMVDWYVYYKDPLK